MTIRLNSVIACSFVLAALLPVNSADGKFSIVAQHKLFPAGSGPWSFDCHAATIAQAADGTVVAAWNGGAFETHSGRAVWLSRFENGCWTPPVKVGDGEETGPGYMTENPVLFQPAGGPLMLFYTVGPGLRDRKLDPSGRNAWGVLKTSADHGRTWSAARPLGRDKRLPGGRLIGPTKNPPIQLEDGSILVPSSNEYGLRETRDWDRLTWHFEQSRDMGATWSLVAIFPSNPDLRPIQPGLLRLGAGRLLALGRNEGQGPDTPMATSTNGGATWSAISGLTALPQTHSGIAVGTLRNGIHFCILNPAKAWRRQLDLMVSSDGTNWTHGLTLDPDGGDLAHYPQAVQTPDGRLHVVFTSGPEQPSAAGKVIRHLIVAFAAVGVGVPTPPNAEVLFDGRPGTLHEK